MDAGSSSGASFARRKIIEDNSYNGKMTQPLLSFTAFLLIIAE